MEWQAVEDDSAASDALSCSSSEHPMSFFKGMSNLRDKALFCDVILRVGEKTFPAHKCVLAIFSPYFSAMFTSGLKESHDREVTLRDIEPAILESLLEFFYTGTIRISQDNVQSLVGTSNVLQVLWVLDACSLFLSKHINPSNCLGIQCFADTMNMEKLQEAAKKFSLSNLPALADQEEFLNLSRDKLIELVSSDDLNVQREEDVFTAVLKWFNYQPEARKDDFHKVLACVRLPLMSSHFLHDFVSIQEIVRTSPECRILLEEALLYHWLPDRRGNMQGIRTLPRAGSRLAEVIVCAVGYDITSLRRWIEAFDTISNEWAPLGDLPFAVDEPEVVVTGQNMYVVGGCNENLMSSSRVWKFDALTNTWEEMASMSCARAEFGVAVLEGFLYAVGGRGDTRILASIERYNMETNQWEQLPSMQEALSYCTVLAHDGYLYVAGGVNADSEMHIRTVQRFDPSTRTWADMAPMPTPRSGSAGCVLDGKLYIIGGLKGSTVTTATNEVWCYDVLNNRWDACSPMGVGRDFPGVAVMGGHIYVLGGEDNQKEQLNSVERYTPATDQWEDVIEMTMPSPRNQLACAALKIPKSLLPSGQR